MARKARQRISYVLPLANSPGGHRLGVNGLAVDSEQSILYSGGRDGLICAWDLNVKLKKDSDEADNPFTSPEDPPEPPSDSSSKTATATTFRNQVQAHTHWVNDIVLVQGNAALVSASSDITVKLWRPHSEEGQAAQTIGVHSDYVKCLATPGPHADWVASGGLDHKISLWDLNGAGQKMQIQIGEAENVSKGSIYALSVMGSIMASGGPESVVRVWDPKSGKSITKFVGHTDNVRDILISQEGDMIMTASSDQTVKLWSMTAGRCMNTLTMHNDSVWSLWSDHPRLSVFYSTDRSGLVAKTDARGCDEFDEGISVAICQEHEGVNKLVAVGDYLWTSTSSSSINRWKDVDTTADIGRPPSPKHHRGPSEASSKHPPTMNGTAKKQIPYASLLRLSATAFMPGSKPKDPESGTVYSSITARKASEVLLDEDAGPIAPIQELPEDTIEGQNGLIKHVMLNDRKRVLTLDTAGEVIMWDLLKCVPIKSYGKRHLEDVAPEVNTLESVANWCAVDTRTGKLSCVLEENYCFDAEMYADDVDVDEKVDFREDQRVNLGKWVLRYLFANLIDEEIRRDDSHRQSLLTSSQEATGLQRSNAPASISIPPAVNTFETQIGMSTSPDAMATPRPTNGHGFAPFTPGLSIGVATPGIPQSHQNSMTSHLPSTAEEGSTPLEKRVSHLSNPRDSLAEKSNDYFSPNPNTQPSESSSDTNQKSEQTNVDSTLTALPQSASEPETKEKPKEGKEAKEGGLFGKKFMKGMKFPKTLNRTSVDSKPPDKIEEKASMEESDKSSEREEKVFEDNFFGIVQKVRHEYEEYLAANPGQPIPTAITPSPPSDTPVLKPPSNTTVIIQEDNPSSGGVADVFRGTVGTLAKDADVIEKTAPIWLGDLLLRNNTPYKDTVKVSFVLQPYQDILPSIASQDGNSRLNANRMLRAKKILAYVAERIEPAPEKPDPNALKPEEYLELYCQNQVVPTNMTLATLRVHIWKTGGDVLLFYKANGKKAIKHVKLPSADESKTEEKGKETGDEERETTPAS